MTTDQPSDSSVTSTTPSAASAPSEPTAEESSTAGEGEGDGPPDDAEERTGRDVVVPMRVYKTVTVFSTLIAVLAVVTGFVLLDAATLGVSVLRELVVLGLSAVGLSVPDGALSAAFAALGLAVIAAGAGVYVLGTRFRARGMGNSQEDSGEGSDNG
jgi:hypothetical protein